MYPQKIEERAWKYHLETLTQDMRYFMRLLLKNRAFMAVITLTLALGIGVNTALFSIVDRILRPLPCPNSDQLVSVFYKPRQGPAFFDAISYPDFTFYRGNNQVFSDLAAYTDITANILFPDGTERLGGEAVSGNYFSALGMRPLLGRFFLPEEDQVPANNPVVVLSHMAWVNRFSADVGIIGRKLTINNAPFTVVGVAPRGFVGVRLDRATLCEFWVPTMMYPVIMTSNRSDLERERGTQWLSLIGRLRPEKTLAQAQADISALTEQLKNTYWPDVWRSTDETTKGSPLHWTAVVYKANETLFSPASRKTVLIILGLLIAAAALVLIIACSNVASLTLSNTFMRRREIAVRAALGAGRGRLFRQLVTESVIIVVFGGLIGILIAWAASQYLVKFRYLAGMASLIDSRLDFRVLLYSAVMSLGTGVILSLIPLRTASRLDLTSALETARSGGATQAFHLHKLFVVAQVSLSLVLLISACLLLRTMRNAQAADVTVEPDKVLLVSVDLAARKYDEPRGKQFFSRLLESIRSLPEIHSAALVRIVPMGGRRGGMDILSDPAGTPTQTDFNIVSDGYFETIGLPVLAGRPFTAGDREGAPAVAVVNEPMAQRLWPNRNPIGQKLWLTTSIKTVLKEVEVIGLIRDGKFRNYRSPINPCFYLPFAQQYNNLMHLEARVARDPIAVTPALRRIIQQLDSELPVPKVQTLQSYRDSALTQEKLSSALLTSLGALAMALTTIGLYGAMTFFVSRRTREIGIRIAVGATSAQIAKHVIFDSVKLLAVGLFIGLLVSALIGISISRLLFEISPFDPVSYIAMSGIVVLVGLSASLLPARRAMSVDPIKAILYE
jgi:putative ABC transport system permease protein